MKLLRSPAATLGSAVLSYMQGNVLTASETQAINANCVPQTVRTPLYRTMRLAKKPRGGQAQPIHFAQEFGSVAATREASLSTVLAICRERKTRPNWLATYEVHNVALVLGVDALKAVMQTLDDKELCKAMCKRIDLRQESMIVGHRSYTGVLLKLVAGRYVDDPDTWPDLLEEWEAQL